MQKSFYPPAMAAALAALALSACSSNYAGPKMPKGTALPPPEGTAADEADVPAPLAAQATEPLAASSGSPAPGTASIGN